MDNPREYIRTQKYTFLVDHVVKTVSIPKSYKGALPMEVTAYLNAGYVKQMTLF